MIEIKEVTDLTEIQAPEVGQTVLCNGAPYRWDPIEGWQEVKVEGDTTLAAMNAYDMNKQIISQLPSLSHKELKEKTNLIRKYISDWGHKYYMLLCRELNYYTLLVEDPANAAPNDYFGDVLLECLTYWNIKAIDPNEESGAIEIWIAEPQSNEVHVMYFFPYDNGVIACR